MKKQQLNRNTYRFFQKLQTYGHERLYELSSYEITENDNLDFKHALITVKLAVLSLLLVL